MSFVDRIMHHYESVWGVLPRRIPFVGGPMHELPKEFAVFEFPPRKSRTMWTYATCCMAQEADEYPIELHLFSAQKSGEPVELLVVTAHYHRTGKPLGVGHTVNFGKPWMDDSRCEHGLISLPYLDGPRLENLELVSGKTVKFYWLVPVTAAEVAYKKERGLAELELKFDESNFNYLDPKRSSVV